MKLSMTMRKVLLTIHILFSAIMFGNMVTFLILSITATTTENMVLVESCYQIMHVLSQTSVKASTIGATLTGILLSVLTKWGLFTYYWIIVKQGITLLLIGLNFWGMYAWVLKALNQFDQTSMSMAQADLWIGIIIQIISLIILFAISVFKPWGKRKTKKIRS
ncbi:hypothetical protein [Psychrobacillus sp. L3]|uniref:hypothetical protein n=1 Tax=Psychrobacillus sp. L3 TaxID=3236891 RepID=UPI0036F43A87